MLLEPVTVAFEADHVGVVKKSSPQPMKIRCQLAYVNSNVCGLAKGRLLVMISDACS